MSKKDNGIARLPNGLLIPEALRDELTKQDWSKPRNAGWNPDNATTQELKDKRWSGFRYNEFTRDMELWLLGDMRLARRMDDIANKPSIMAEMHEEVFLTAGTVVEMPIKPTMQARRPNRGTRRRR